MKVLRVLLALAAASVLGLAHAQYPTKPIKIVVANPPGGQTDVATRIIAQEMSTILKQPIIIENKPGANANLGTEWVKTQPADGYTLIVTAINNFGSNPALLKEMPFDPLRDFRMIVHTISSTNVLVVGPDSRFRTLQDLIKEAKANPGKLTFGTAGAGSSMYLFIELLKSMTKIELLHVPYQGSAKANIDVMGGQIDMQFDSMPGASSLIKDGRLRALAVGAEKRFPTLPDVPTMQEAGASNDILVPTYFALLAPAGTPPAIVARLNEEMKKAVADQHVTERLGGAGLLPVGSSPEQMAASVKSDLPRFQTLVKSIGIKPE